MNKDVSNRGWSPNELVDQKSKRHGLFQWWYDKTSIPDPPVNASFAQREAARKSHLLSTIVFWLLVTFILFIPGCFALPNHYVIYADLGMLALCIPALFFNRAKKPQIAGILLTFAFEAALTMVVFTTWPLDEPSIQQFELFVFGELLCVSLLAPGTVFIVMIYNMAVITVSLLWQPHDPVLNHDLASQLIPMLVRPVGVQLLVAFVAFLWVSGTNQAAKRADKAEMIAKLEHELADQKQELEQGIQLILETHIEVANGNLNARAPLNQGNVLWQISRALNTLLIRFQRAAQAEKDLQRVEYAVNMTVQSIQHADARNQNPRISVTYTQIDPLIAALQGKTIDFTAVPFDPRSSQRARE
ncbi:hypothetical protein [Ktedonobacter racemifer]|uniref:HAMP domain-containing protein n=1 Tax=Ktedonobacter racemifer DSM 44963 TaxID=485913 RepID=D6TEC7_KTERA|nr:hypothetical protein [Ktedonobacter racemifer]EFH90300.1 hypothetical protein Krac_11916 [Ktedonobacter racemifer DSM 44963]